MQKKVSATSVHYLKVSHLKVTIFLIPRTDRIEAESSNLNVIIVRSDPNLKRAPDVTGQSQNKTRI